MNGKTITFVSAEQQSKGISLKTSPDNQMLSALVARGVTITPAQSTAPGDTTLFILCPTSSLFLPTIRDCILICSFSLKKIIGIVAQTKANVVLECNVSWVCVLVRSDSGNHVYVCLAVVRQGTNSSGR
jgi:hypothetical protein